jgi:hypothetical protein
MIRPLRLAIERTWDGRPALPEEHAELNLAADGQLLRIDLKARFHGDPAPAGSKGPTDRLWEYEVVELFVSGADEHYLEVEVGPHGHYLALQLEGPRNIVASRLEIACEVHRSSDYWTAQLEVPLCLLPAAPRLVNAYAIHGTAAQRRYLAWQPVPGERPDFHRLDCFAPLVLPGLD